jgi:hypothetical protein
LPDAGASFQVDNKGDKDLSPKARVEAPKALRVAGRGRGIPLPTENLRIFYVEKLHSGELCG